MRSREMDKLGALDLRYERKTTHSSANFSNASGESHPLDLRTSPITQKFSTTIVQSKSHVEHSRPSVITSNLLSSSVTLSQRSRWNHRSHPSIDSDSSFESEQENDSIHFSLWPSTIPGSNVGSRKCIISESISTNYLPDSFPTDTENESEGCDRSSPESKMIYKDLPALTANVSIGNKRRDSVVLELSSCEAEIIDAEDIQSELKCEVLNFTNSSFEEDSDDTNENSLQINETIEELFKLQAKHTNHPKKMASKISAGIEETATKYIKEIRKTRSDMSTQGLNLVVDGNKKQRCVKCNEEFYSVAALLGHLMSHSSRNPGEKLIKCPVCVKRFSTLTTLEIHIQRLHTGEMKYICQVCETPYKFSTHLRKHMVSSRCGKGTKKIM